MVIYWVDNLPFFKALYALTRSGRCMESVCVASQGDISKIEDQKTRFVDKATIGSRARVTELPCRIIVGVDIQPIFRHLYYQR